MTTTVGSAAAQSRVVLVRATSRLLDLQHADGYWKGELETNVTIDAEDLFLRHYLDILDDGTASAAARWIRSKQRDDGSWATFFGGPPDLSTTVEAYVGLRLAGDPLDAPHMRRAAASVRSLGGVPRARVFTKMWLSLLGLWDWEQVPAVPPEQLLLPDRAPLSIYSFACWARQTIVALQVVTTLQPVRPVGFPIDDLGPSLDGRRPLFDRLLHAYGRRPVGSLRRGALHAAVAWILDRQEVDGSWGGIQPPWVWSIVALHAWGLPLDDARLRGAMRGLDSFTIEDGAGRRIEACQSPVWDTALALIALLDAGVDRDHVAIRRGASWLAEREITMRGDWATRRPHLEPGGFAFEFANDWHPDIDDTAEVAIALVRTGIGLDAAERGLEWVLGMQSRGGGWAAFDADNSSRLPARLPFCDFGEVTDPPSADVTAHVLEALAIAGRPATPEVSRGIGYLLSEQEQDGSWFGRWGANHVYGTGAAVPALVAWGLRSHDSVRRAVAWLESVQNPDGGFGEDLRSYRDPAWRGRGESTASQTAWAMLALDAAGARSDAMDGAVRWLVETQLENGSWDEPWFTGTGFPGDFYLNYHLYRQVFPVSALARVLRKDGRE